jgi:hypothetical protein
MDGIDERQPSSEGTSRTRGALDGDWSEGVPGPAYAHGLPSPEALGLPAEREATAPVAVATVAREAPVEPAVEAPADWGVAADQAAEPPPAEAEVEVEVAAEDDFPVTLSEADEIHEETTAPIDLTPAEESAFEAEPIEVEAEPSDVEVLRTEVEVRTADPTPPPPPPEAASAEWLAHPDAAAADTTATASWEEATYAGESTLESAFAAAEAAQASGAGSEFAAGPAFTAPGALDAWGEPTVPAPSASSEIEPWAVPVDTPWDGSSPLADEAQRAPEIATPDSVGELTEEPPEPDVGQGAALELASPDAVSELTEEPPEPDWATGPRELFSPLAKGETLADDGSAPAFEPGRTTPQRLELVRGPDTLEDPDLLMPVEDATPPMGVTPLEPGPAPIVPGEQRVAIHTRAGQTKRGTVIDLDLSQPHIPLEPQGGGSTETIDHGEVKAIFFMLAPGEKAEPGLGQAVRVTFSDGRAIEGHRDGDESRDGFFLVPLDAQRTNTRRIYVARDAVAEIVDLPQ